jgi:glucosamine--fructose-6-phosphate aminotransferase (isomerizing)
LASNFFFTKLSGIFMCGIFAQIGTEQTAAQNTLEGLKRLEYRGYDSWGVAWLPEDDPERLQLKKETGKIGEAELSARASVALGHTRWASHGGVTQANAHPHVSEHGSVVIVHNGIVENYKELKERLLEQGVKFLSDTDTEVFAQLVELELASADDLREAVFTVFARVTGLNAVVVLQPSTQTLVAVRSGSPLCVGRSESGYFLASDATALAEHVSEVYYLKDGEGVECTKDSLVVYRAADSSVVDIEWEPLTIQVEDLALGEYPHFLLKEIHEQQRVIRGIADTAESAVVAYSQWMGRAQQTLVGCGSAYFAAQIGKAFLAEIAGEMVQTFSGTEFESVRDLLTEKDKVTFLSQSGESIDIVEHLPHLKKLGVEYGALVNRLGSTLERESAHKILLGAGPEQCVLATKSWLAKVAVLYLLAMERAGEFTQGQAKLREFGTLLLRVINEEYRAEHLAPIIDRLKDHQHIIVIGRGVGHPFALEAALKIKEVTYIHAEGFPAGELRHGVIALIEPGMPCIVMMPGQDAKHQTTAMLTHAMELKSRGAWTIGIGSTPNEVFETFLPVPDIGILSNAVQSVVVQQLAYLLAVALGNDPDKPRNLAKSVTVR